MDRKKASTRTDKADPELREHIVGLGLDTIEQYREWCGLNGFSQKLNKNWKQRGRERFYVRRAHAQERLKQKKREKRNQADVIKGICAGELGKNDVTQPYLQRLCEVVRTNRGPHHERQVNRPALLGLLTHLNRCRAKFFDGSSVIAELGELPGNTFVEALALAAAHYRDWQRPVDDWKPRSHSARRQFASLLRHLFVQYDDMPAFFDSVWFAGRSAEAARRRKWYLYVGRGQNIRNCKLPIPYTKKMAHHFMHAPNDLTVMQAFRWGQVLGFGGDERLARALFGTRLADNFEQDDFWSTVIRWFASHPMLDRTHVGPIVDYLHYQRFEPEHVYVAPGYQEESPPARPLLSMRGRTPESLLRQVNRWHRNLANSNTHQIRQWPPCGVEGYEWIEGSRHGGNWKRWTIRELLGSRALVAEGRQMKHCVATYASSCARGHCSIWTMEVESQEGQVKAITIEIRNQTRTICQARGRWNRIPNEKERGVLRRWAAAVGLRITSYV